jgi:uncharacterized protein (TIGR03435 family)
MANTRPILCSCLLVASLSAQAQPEFEVASIRPSAEQVEKGVGRVQISGSQVRVSSLPLRDYVALAYELRINQIEAPDWLAQTRFDVAAKLPAGSSAEQVPQMLLKLLIDRFELKAHRSSKEFAVYALTPGSGGPKLKEAAVDPATVVSAPGTVNVAASGSAAGVSVDLGDGSYFSLVDNRLEIKTATMASVAETLTRLLDRPVIDSTRLTGRYNMVFELTPEDYNGTLIRSAINAGVVLPPQALRVLDTASLDPFSRGLEKYGLSLESRRAPLDIVIVDSMRKVPTEN